MSSWCPNQWNHHCPVGVGLKPSKTIWNHLPAKAVVSLFVFQKSGHITRRMCCCIMCCFLCYHLCGCAVLHFPLLLSCFTRFLWFCLLFPSCIDSLLKSLDPRRAKVCAWACCAVRLLCANIAILLAIWFSSVSHVCSVASVSVCVDMCMFLVCRSCLTVSCLISFQTALLNPWDQRLSLCPSSNSLASSSLQSSDKKRLYLLHSSGNVALDNLTVMFLWTSKLNWCRRFMRTHNAH